MTHVSLFTGIGGFDLACDWLGIDTVLQCEIDQYCLKVLEKHWPNVRRIHDVREVKGADCGEPWLITGGIPCQPFSLAGRRLGKTDPRNLWTEMSRVIQEARPRWTILENVDAIDGLALGDCIFDLEVAGYEVLPPLEIPAAGVGARHKRFRVWVVAYAKEFAFGPRLCKNESQGVGRGRLGDVCVSDRVQPCPCCGEDFCNWHQVHRGECGCPDPFDNEENPEPGWWAVEPNVGRVADGVPSRVDRLRGLGNAIVPQVAYEVIKAMVATEQAL